MIYVNPFVAKKKKKTTWESKHLVIFRFPKRKVKRKGAGDGRCPRASIFACGFLFVCLLGRRRLFIAVHSLFLVAMRKGCSLAVLHRLVSVVAEAPLVGSTWAPGLQGTWAP